MTPTQLLPVGDAYLQARITVLDADPPCQPPPGRCDGEFNTCSDRSSVLAGTTYTMVSDIATAGFTNPSRTSGINLALSATDLGARMGLRLSIRLNDASMLPGPAGYVTTPPPMSAIRGFETYVNLDEHCDIFNTNLVQVSRYLAIDPSNALYPPGARTSVNITQAEVSGGQIVAARPTGAGTFSPAGVLAGTFSFVGQARQESPLGATISLVQVDGCFRLNLPDVESGVPATPTPTTGGCT